MNSCQVGIESLDGVNPALAVPQSLAAIRDAQGDVPLRLRRVDIGIFGWLPFRACRTWQARKDALAAAYLGPTAVSHLLDRYRRAYSLCAKRAALLAAVIPLAGRVLNMGKRSASEVRAPDRGAAGLMRPLGRSARGLACWIR